MLHGEHRRRAVAAAASRPADASRRRGQGGTRRLSRRPQPLKTMFVKKINGPISWSTAKIMLASSPRPYAVDVTIRRVLRACPNKRAQNTAGPTPRPRSARFHGFGTDHRPRRGRAAGRHPSDHWPGGAAGGRLVRAARASVARPVDDLWSSSASRDWCGASPPPREAPLRRGCALQMLGVWLGAAARAALISVPFAGTAASTYESSEGAGAPIAA